MASAAVTVIFTTVVELDELEETTTAAIRALVHEDPHGFLSDASTLDVLVDVAEGSTDAP